MFQSSSVPLIRVFIEFLDVVLAAWKCVQLAFRSCRNLSLACFEIVKSDWLVEYRAVNFDVF